MGPRSGGASLSYVYTLVKNSSGLQFRRIILTGSSSIGYRAMVPHNLLYAGVCDWDCSKFCLLPRLLSSDRAPEQEPQQLLLPFLRYRPKGIFNGNQVVGACLRLLCETDSPLTTFADKNGVFTPYILSL